MRRYNKKNVVSRYASNTRPAPYYTTKNNNNNKLLFVRNLPKDVRYGFDSYKRSQTQLIRDLGQYKNTGASCASWLNQYDHFKELKSAKYEINTSTANFIRSYIDKIKGYYMSLSKTSHQELSGKIEQLNNEWGQAHKGHEIPMMNNIIKKKPHDEQTPLDKEYLSLLSVLQRSHVPNVYCSPKECPNKWDYLTNCIKLISQRNTVCFSFDIEAYERDNNVITEIGISIYDPRENQHALNPILRNYHLVVAESLSLVNRNWVLDMKECYLLGESLVLPLKQCVDFIQNLINFYMVHDPETSNSWKRAFVGHNIEGDIKWLRSIGVVLPETEIASNAFLKTVDNSTTLIMDTMKIYAACYGQEGSSLGKILRLFKLPHAFLHNAGNDAYYTLRLLLYLCDVNTRIECSLDDITAFQTKAKQYLNRAKEENKIIPMSYSLTIKSNQQNNNNYGNNNNYKKKKDLVPQTEFGGSKWFPNSKEAFESTIDCKDNIFKDL